jgi:chromosome segregation ATPase
MTQGQLQDALQRLQKANEAEKAIALRLKDLEDMLSVTTARFYEAKSTIDQLRTDNETLQHEKREAAHQNQALLQVVDSSRRRMSQVQGLLRQTNQVLNCWSIKARTLNNCFGLVTLFVFFFLLIFLFIYLFIIIIIIIIIIIMLVLIF